MKKTMWHQNILRYNNQNTFCSHYCLSFLSYLSLNNNIYIDEELEFLHDNRTSNFILQIWENYFHVLLLTVLKYVECT